MSYIDTEFFEHGHLADFDLSEHGYEHFPQATAIRELNQWLMALMTNGAQAVQGSSLAPEMVGTAIMVRGVELFQGAYVMTQRGMVTPARVLIRCLLEDLFNIALLHIEPEKIISRLKADNVQSRSGLAKILLGVKGLSNEAVTNLEQIIGKRESVDGVQAIAVAAGLSKAYVWYKHYSNISMHTSADSLSPLMRFDESHRPIGFTFSDCSRDTVSETLDNLLEFGLCLGLAYNDLTHDSLTPGFDIAGLASRCEVG